MIYVWRPFIATKPVWRALKYLYNHSNLMISGLSSCWTWLSSLCVYSITKQRPTVWRSSEPQTSPWDFLTERCFPSLQCVCDTQRSVVFLKDGQRVMTECVQCELELNKHREGMEKYSRSSVEVLLLLYSSQDLGFIDVDGLVSGFGNVLGNSGLNRILILIRELCKQPTLHVACYSPNTSK